MDGTYGEKSTEIFATIFLLFIDKKLGNGKQNQLLSENTFLLKDLDYTFDLTK